MKLRNRSMAENVTDSSKFALRGCQRQVNHLHQYSAVEHGRRQLPWRRLGQKL